MPIFALFAIGTIATAAIASCVNGRCKRDPSDVAASVTFNATTASYASVTSICLQDMEQANDSPDRISVTTSFDPASGSLIANNVPPTCIQAIEFYNTRPDIAELNAQYGTISVEQSTMTVTGMPDWLVDTAYRSTAVKNVEAKGFVA